MRTIRLTIEFEATDDVCLKNLTSGVMYALDVVQDAGELVDPPGSVEKYKLVEIQGE